MTKSRGIGRHPPSQRKHGHSFVNGKATPEYDAWSSMKKRCMNPNSQYYKRYGGRGIKICSSWLESFEAFLADMGPRPSSAHSLDRIDNDGNYESSNCRWANQREQQRNRSNLAKLEIDGRDVLRVELLEKSGLNCSTFTNRLARGWPIEEALNAKKRR